MIHPKKASEVLSGALEFWGTRGERWVAGVLDTGTRACLYGGLGMAAYGYATYEPPRVRGQAAADKAFNRAKTLILDELESRGWVQDLVQFNDNQSSTIARRTRKHRFDVVKKDVVCCALKRAMKEEEEGGNTKETAT